jgi:hypothetical protein
MPITIKELLDENAFADGLTPAEVLSFAELGAPRLQAWFERKRLPESDFPYGPGQGKLRRYSLKQAWVLFWISILSDAGIEIEKAVPLARQFDFTARFGIAALISEVSPGATVEELARDLSRGTGVFSTPEELARLCNRPEPDPAWAFTVLVFRRSTGIAMAASTAKTSSAGDFDLKPLEPGKDLAEAMKRYAAFSVRALHIAGLFVGGLIRLEHLYEARKA